MHRLLKNVLENQIVFILINDFLRIINQLFSFSKIVDKAGFIDMGR